MGSRAVWPILYAYEDPDALAKWTKSYFKPTRFLDKPSIIRFPQDTLKRWNLT